MFQAQQALLTTFLRNAEDDKYSLKERLKFALKADSLATIQNNNQGRLESFRLISNLYIDQDSIQLAKAYLLKTILLAKSTSNQDELAVALNSLGAIYTATSKYDSALEFYNSSTFIFRNTHNQKYLAQTLINIGVVLKNQGDFQRAFKVTLDAIKILESEKDTRDLAAAYSTLGNILKELNRLDDALHYHQMALQLLQVNNDSANIALSLNNIGNVFRYKREYAKALNNYLQALDINRKLRHLKTLATITDNIGQVYFELKDYNNSEKYFLKALDLCITSNDKDGFLTTSIRLSKLYLEENEIQEAEGVALKALSISPQTGFLKQRLENNLMLFEIYRKSGIYNLASNYAHKSLELKDSLFNSNMAERISQMKVKYETEKKDIENVSLKKDKIINTAKLEEQRSQKLIWIISSISIFFLSGLMFYVWRKRKNYRFEQQIACVKQEALNAQMSDHFISNAMDSINSFIENNDKQKASDYLLLFHRLIRQVLENSFKNLIPIEAEMEVIRMYIDLEKLRFPADSFSYEIAIDEDINAAYTYIPPMVFQVLIENSIKHGFKRDIGGDLKIKIKKHEDCIKCSVEDNGIGLSVARRSKHEIGKEGVSFGNSLAEKLINITWHFKHKASYEMRDVMNTENKPSGTLVEFLLPYVSIV